LWSDDDELATPARLVGLLAVSVMFVLFGATDIALGATAEGLIPQALTGKTV
jgi:hypothetical protein